MRINIGPFISYGRGASLANRLCAPALMLPPSPPPPPPPLPISPCIGGEREHCVGSVVAAGKRPCAIQCNFRMTVKLTITRLSLRRMGRLTLV